MRAHSPHAAKVNTGRTVRLNLSLAICLLDFRIFHFGFLDFGIFKNNIDVQQLPSTQCMHPSPQGGPPQGSPVPAAARSPPGSGARPAIGQPVRLRQRMAAEAGPAEPDAVPTARRARRAGPPSAAAMHAPVAKERQQISWEITNQIPGRFWNADQVPAPFAAPSGLDKRMATLHPTIRAGGDQVDLARHPN